MANIHLPGEGSDASASGLSPFFTIAGSIGNALTVISNRLALVKPEDTKTLIDNLNECIPRMTDAIEAMAGAMQDEVELIAQMHGAEQVIPDTQNADDE